MGWIRKELKTFYQGFQNLPRFWRVIIIIAAIRGLIELPDFIGQFSNKPDFGWDPSIFETPGNFEPKE